MSLNKDDLLENRLVDIQIVSVAVLAHCVMTKVLTLIMFYVFIASLPNNTFGSIGPSIIDVDSEGGFKISNLS